jgi:diacylglycerol kinase family enzyme
MRALLTSEPQPVRVAGINDRLFLVNASLGLYPDLLEDREVFKARFGRSRWVALWAAAITMLRAQQHLRLRIEHGDAARALRTLTLFVGNNRLQLEQLGLLPDDDAHPVSDGALTAVALRPVSTWSMLGLMLRGAMGTLGDADGIEHFPFNQLTVRPRLPQGRRGVKVAFDGEVTTLRAPLNFRVMAEPLYLLKPATP